MGSNSRIDRVTPKTIKLSTAIANNALVQLGRRWLQPRSTNRDEAFRERTIRATVSIAGIGSVLALVASSVIFQNEWRLVSYPTLIAIWAVLSVASAVAVHNGRVTQAGWLLVLTLIVGACGVTIIDGFWETNVTPAFMLTVLLTALVLPRSTILPVSLVSLCLFSLIAVLEDASGRTGPTRGTTPVVVLYSTNVFFLLLIEALFLRQLRAEFDSRLGTMRESIQQAELARQEADRANQAKSQFLANMSHELRTPLNAIIGYIEIMLGGMAGTFTEKQTQLQGYVHQNAIRLLELINNILDLARIESDRIQVVATPASPRKIIGDLVESMQSLAQKKNVTLRVSFGEDVPEAVVGDVPKIQQVVTNLIGNAIKFTPQGSVDVALCAGEKQTWQIKVADTGIGMPPDAPNYIFDMFRQVDGADTREHQGSGLGLAITKRLVDRMGGTIAVQTELGKGSTFTVTLPRMISENAKS
jgi:signal transduction histidine kinase